MNSYVCFYQGKRVEVHADTVHQAQCAAARLLIVPHKKQIVIVLVKKNGRPIVPTQECNS